MDKQKIDQMKQDSTSEHGKEVNCHFSIKGYLTQSSVHI